MTMQAGRVDVAEHRPAFPSSVVGGGGTPSLLIVTTVPDTYTAFLAPYAEHLSRRGWRVELATGPGAIPASGQQPLAEVYRFNWTRSIRHVGGWIGSTAAVRRLLDHRQFDIVHTHTPIASLVTRAAVRALPRDRRPAVVYTAHGFHFHPLGRQAQNLMFRSLEKLGGRWTDALIVINDTDHDAAVRHRLVPRERLHAHAGIGVDLGHYVPTSELLAAAGAVRQQLGLASSARLFSVVAELTPRKHVDASIVGLAGTGRREFHLAVAGDGPLRARLEQLSIDLGVADQVHLLGHLLDPRALMLASVATVLPSDREGLSRSVLESIALGVPVIGSNVRGIKDLVSAGVGILIEPGDGEAVARAMLELGDAPEPAAGRAERYRAGLTRHGLDDLLLRHERLYEELLASRTLGRRRPGAA
jgi:glycosyltransferase involved in cell wall biosynthesis